MALEVWTLGEQHEGKVERISYELLMRGRALADKLGSKLATVLIGDDIDREGLTRLFERGCGYRVSCRRTEIEILYE